MKHITIQGARIHNLQNLHVTIPKSKLTVITGVSGSGKSSLAFDLVFEEGRKAYFQSLGMLTPIEDEDKFDHILGIGPAVAVQQNIIRQSNPRSTVGSKTNILKMLALLYAAEGRGAYIEEEPLPATYFLYNSPDGMCIRCSGKGVFYRLDMDKLIPNDHVTLRRVFQKARPTPGYAKLLNKRYSDYLDIPFSKIPEEVKADILYGQYVSSNSQNRSYCLYRIFEGRYLRTGDDSGGIYRLVTCPSCQGYRIGEEAQEVQLGGKHIGELGRLTLEVLYTFLNELLKNQKLSTLGRNLLSDILDRLQGLLEAHLGYLSLYREMSTLSGGELQRLFLNGHLASKMESLIYILDEPTAGLHEAEKAELLHAIMSLKALGNTIIMVEHDPHMIKMADYIIDIGPRAGSEGGQIMYQGDFAGLLKCEASITGQYLSGRRTMPQRKCRSTKIDDEVQWLTISHACTHNLQDVTVSIPLGKFVGIAGVSGSGKSSLISDTLITCLRRYSNQEYRKGEQLDEDNSTTCDIERVTLDGFEHISGFVQVSQRPIGRNRNSNVITYIGIWDKIRQLFAKEGDVIHKHLTASYFSFNSKGACPECGGSGEEKVWLGGNAFLTSRCKACHGKRYGEEALAIRYKGKNITEVLDMTVSEALAFFKEYKTITPTLQILDDVGMGYIKLGQETPTLSGGEAQRIKLAKELGRKPRGSMLYIFDEPTVGLSQYDTGKLIELLDDLVVRGNSVIVVEHDPEVLAACDWLVELGPSGGTEGGRVIAEGALAVIKENPKSITGRYL